MDTKIHFFYFKSCTWSTPVLETVKKRYSERNHLVYSATIPIFFIFMVTTTVRPDMWKVKDDSRLNIEVPGRDETTTGISLVFTVESCGEPMAAPCREPTSPSPEALSWRGAVLEWIDSNARAASRGVSFSAQGEPVQQASPRNQALRCCLPRIAT